MTLQTLCSLQNYNSPKAFSLIFWHVVCLCRIDANAEHATFDFDVSPFLEVLG